MKSYILIMAITFFAVCGYAQIAAIQINYQNTLFIGKDNTLTVVAAGYSCDSLIVTISEGTITGAKGHYIVRVEEPGIVKIATSVKTKKGVKTLSQSEMRVKHMREHTSK